MLTSTIVAMMIASPANDSAPARQYFRGRRKRSRATRFGAVEQNPPDPHRPRDILDRLFATIFVAQREPVAHLIIDSARNIDTARFGETLQTAPRR